MAHRTREEAAPPRVHELDSEPRLWLPARFARMGEASSRCRLEFLVPPTFEEVTGTPSNAGDLWDDLRNWDSLPVLAGLNVVSEISHYDEAVERAAEERYVRPRYRLSRTVGGPEPQPDYRFVFNRVGILIAMKGAIAACDSIGRLSPADDYRLGDAVLRANAFINSSRFQHLKVPPSDIELAAETMPTWELTNPRDLAYGLARTYRMLEHLRGTDQIVAQLTGQLGLVFQDLRFDGLPLEDFVAVVFGLYAYASTLNPGLLLQDPVAGAINTERFLSNVKLPQKLMDDFLTSRSIQLPQLRERLTGGKPLDRDEYIAEMGGPIFATDFRVFRERPLMDIGGGNHVILDLQFLTELLFSGLFFRLFFSLPAAEREQFSSLWGRIFELSLVELLEYYYPGPAGILQTDIPFDKGQVDAMLDFGDSIILFEFKHFTLLHSAKYSHDAVALQEELRLKLVENQKGNPKAVRQLACSSAAVRDGRVPSLLGKTSRFSGRTTALYPVVVVADPGLEALGVNGFLNDIFQSHVAGLDVKPLTVMSIQELEDLLPCTQPGYISWAELLERRFDGPRVKLMSVHQARYDLLVAKSAPYVRNEFRLQQLAAIYSQVRARYEGGA